MWNDCDRADWPKRGILSPLDAWRFGVVGLQQPAARPQDRVEVHDDHNRLRKAEACSMSQARGLVVGESMGDPVVSRSSHAALRRCESRIVVGLLGFLRPRVHSFTPRRVSQVRILPRA